ncbi:MAG: LTA synthase family protein [Clostridium sp.]|nr:LTA synthase family protein [Acetatifactor muris]MCM1526036.1 LTA synthase family protein [Bacteroides sp.]MCM1562204.1 LTA synthase family protein [Clostridium sp.]
MLKITRDNKIPEERKKWFYVIGLAGAILLYAYYVPFLLDYYVLRPEESFLDFWQVNLLDPVYEFESIVICLCLCILYCIIMNGGVNALILSCALFALSYGGYIKYLNRRELLRLDDLRLTETAGMAMGLAQVEYGGYLLLLVVGLLLLTAPGFVVERLRDRAPDKGRGNRWVKLLIRCGAGVALCVIFCVYSRWFFGLQMDKETVEQTDFVKVETDRYVLYQFLFNENLTSISPENIEASYARLFKATETGETVDETFDGSVRPNVIVILNESWWNTDNILSDKVTFSQDPMGPYKELSGKCVTGYLTSNVYGGGTVSSEAEFLTGLNTKYCPSASTVYATTLDRRLPSVVDYFNALDYETVAIHPYYGWFYDRDIVYQNYGFGKTVFDEDMTYRELYSRYISDESLAKQIIMEYEEAEGPRFIWAISVANHWRIMDYHEESVEDYSYPITVNVEGVISDKDYDILVNYVNGIYLANLAYEELVEYFEQTEEPTVVVMYGDHIPDFSAEALKVLGLNPDDNSEEPVERLYSVPVALWSNCSEEEIAFTGKSIWYLPWMVLEYAGLPDSRMTRLLAYERNFFKADSREIVTDAEGNAIDRYSAEQLEVMRHFQAVTYDILYGKELYPDLWKPLYGTVER